MPRRRRPPLVLLVLPVLLAGGAVAEAAPALEDRVRALVAPYLEADVLVGGVVGVVEDGKARAFGFGRVRRGADEAPDADTVYEIGSITKVFTGVLLADMVGRGEVRLGQAVEDLLPDGVPVPRAGDGPITLVDLSTHRSGLPRMPSNFRPADPGNPYADYDARRLYEWLRSAAVDRAPGARYAYSNVGVGLLGHALARRVGSGYEAAIRTRVLDPLGMKDTAVTLSDALRSRRAPGYTADLEETQGWDLDAFAGAGGLRSTVHDLLTFLQANLAEDGPLRPSFDLAMAVHSRAPGGPEMGLGWHHGPKTPECWHNGQTGGYHSFLALRRDEKVGVVLLTNTATGLVDALGADVLRVVRGEAPRGAAPRGAVPIEAEALDAYVGAYRLSPATTIEVTRVGPRLYLEATGQRRVVLHHAGQDRFFLRVADGEFAFARGEDGEVVRLEVISKDGRFPAPRIE